MMYMSHIDSSPFEFAFFVFLAVVETTMLFDEKRFGVRIFRPFLRRPAKEVEEEKNAVVRKFKLNEGN